MVKTCYTREGNPFQVDEEDYMVINTLKWQTLGRQQNGKGGAITTTITIGRLLLLLTVAKNHQQGIATEVDHINGDIFDNTRGNLRIVSKSENAHHKWARWAFERLEHGVKCNRNCEKRATRLFRRIPARRYVYLCDDHFLAFNPSGETVSDRVLLEEIGSNGKVSDMHTNISLPTVDAQNTS